jgi:hypothetical protein
MKLQADPRILDLISSYPAEAQKQLLELRELIIETAEETEGVNELEESLKWGEPSYGCKTGTTIRMDWKEKQPDQYALYFQCTSKVVPTAKTLFKNQLNFEGNRAIVLPLNEPLPKNILKQCLVLALRYHKVKHLPLLGA